MFEPVRGGTRGGQAEFKWSDVSADKDREHYLGHSINAPTGRWQKNKDVHWYNRDQSEADDERANEIKKIKELEAQALAAVLGYEPTVGSTSGPASGSNAISVPSGITSDSGDVEARRKEKEEKRHRKEEKRARKELKKASKTAAKVEDRSRRRSSRSISPRMRYKDHRDTGRRPRSRSRSKSPSRDHVKSAPDYDAEERERERVRDRRRWELNTRRDQPLDRRRH